MINTKIKSLADLKEVIADLKAKGKRIVFTNGCFDLLHLGHIRLLKEAGSKGDILIVGLNSDSSVRAIKGEGRPITPQTERAQVLAALECVDYVVIFDELVPLDLIHALKPDVLIKGGDWKQEEVVGKDFVESLGGKVETVALVEGRSTKSIIKTILEKFR